MLRNPVDEQGTSTIGKGFLEQFESFLRKRDGHLAFLIVDAFRGIEAHIPNGAVVKEEISPKTAFEALNVVKKKVSAIIHGKFEPIPFEEWKAVVIQLDQVFWDYVEILENYVAELNHQLEQMDLDLIDAEVLEVVHAISEKIQFKVREVSETIRGLEEQLQKGQDATVARQSTYLLLRRWLSWGRSLLDWSLLATLNKTSRFFVSQVKEIEEKHRQYQRLSAKIEGSLHKFQRYRVMSSLEFNVRQNLVDIYRFLKMWKVNFSGKHLPEYDLARVFRRLIAIDEATDCLKQYHKALRESIFNESRRLKGMLEEEPIVDEQMKPLIQPKLRGYSAELHTLGSMLGRYRDFLLRTDPNPYIRSRWGFSETVVGTEPAETRQLLRVSLEVESLDVLLWQLIEALDRPPASQIPIRNTSRHYEIQSILHDMAQPMASRHMMRKRADSLIELLQECDELATTNAKDVEYIGYVLARAMRADWRYRALFEQPAFHQVYATHRGIIGALEDPHHRENVSLLKQLLRQVEEWAKAGDISVHCREIEAAINKIAVEFQGTYDLMDTLGKEKKALRKQRQQLLEYRYLFGCICFYLFQQEAGRERLSNRCIFTEQCLESLESKLAELGGYPLSEE